MSQSNLLPSRNENQKNNNNIDSKTIHKAFVVKKFNSSKSSDNLIYNEIDQYFNSPEKFFDVNSPISINKKINLSKIDVLNKTLFRDLDKGKEKNARKPKFTKDDGKSVTVDNKSALFTKLNSQSSLINFSYFEYIDNDKLKNVFKNFKHQKAKSTKDIYNNKLKTRNELPKEIFQNLSTQNKRLDSKISFDNQSKKMSKYLSAKLHKKERDLLFNGVYLYRYKKEILADNSSKFKKMTSNSCLYKWISSLRRPNNFIGVRQSYVNVSNDENPLWSVVVEKFPENKEISVKPGYNLNNKEFKDFKRNLSSLNSERLKNVENLDSLNIKGENLYNLEYKREMGNKNKKILHKVFVDNGKAVFYNDINDLYGNSTIYKNYRNSSC